MQPDVGAFLLYNSGKSVHGNALRVLEHALGTGNTAASGVNPADPFNPGRANFRPTDITVLFGMANLKYFNGRFFFNTEVDTGNKPQETTEANLTKSWPPKHLLEFWVE